MLTSLFNKDRGTNIADCFHAKWATFLLPVRKFAFWNGLIFYCWLGVSKWESVGQMERQSASEATSSCSLFSKSSAAKNLPYLFPKFDRKGSIVTSKPETYRSRTGALDDDGKRSLYLSLRFIYMLLCLIETIQLFKIYSHVRTKQFNEGS